MVFLVLALLAGELLGARGSLGAWLGLGALALGQRLLEELLLWAFAGNVGVLLASFGGQVARGVS